MLRSLVVSMAFVLLGCMGAQKTASVTIDISALGEVRIDGDWPLPMDERTFQQLHRQFPMYEGRRLVQKTLQIGFDMAVYDAQGMTAWEEGISLDCGRVRFWDDSVPAKAFSGTISILGGDRISPCTESRALFDALSPHWKGQGPYRFGAVDFGGTTVEVGGAVDGSRVDGVSIYRR